MAPNLVKVGKFRLRKKLAIFDYDWTLVRPKTNGTFSKNIDDWNWLTSTVPQVLENIYMKGYCIIVISNQTRNTKMKTDQIVHVMSTLHIPSLVIVAYEESDKKPNTIMFDILKTMTSKPFDMTVSYYVGDALGRQDDWSDSDKQFAENIGLKVFSPDEIFASKQNKEIRIKTKDEQEIIVMVGYPGSGKSTIADSIGDRYKVLHGDELVTSKKMIKEAEKVIISGFSVVFDATNPTIKKRAEYINIAKKYKLPIRCIVMKTDMMEAIFRNNKRNKVIPKITYYIFRKNYEEPSTDEGFEEVISLY